MNLYAQFVLNLPDEDIDALVEEHFGYRLSDYKRGPIARWKFRQALADHFNREDKNGPVLQ